MKRLLYIAAVALLTAACSNENEELNTEKLVPVTVQVSDFSISLDEPETRAAQNIADYAGIKVITLVFYDANGTEVYKTTRQKSDNTTYTTFGRFNLNLYKGSYKMVVLGYGQSEGDVFTLTSPTEAAFTGAHARETFAATQPVSITGTNAVNLSATLNRIVSKLMLYSSDYRTEDATNIRVTFSAGGKSFNPTTGLALSNDGLTNTVSISSEVGTPSSSVSYLFLASDEQSIDVTIDVLNAQGNSISHRVVNSVPFKRNRTTNLTGAIYSAPITSTFQVDADWLPPYEVSF